MTAVTTVTPQWLPVRFQGGNLVVPRAALELALSPGTADSFTARVLAFTPTGPACLPALNLEIDGQVEIGGYCVKLISLKKGPTVPVDAIQLAITLEARGFKLGLDSDQRIAVEATGTSGMLTAADREAVRLWSSHLAAIVVYAAEVCR